jgi:hypothetical protein
MIAEGFARRLARVLRRNRRSQPVVHWLSTGWGVILVAVAIVGTLHGVRPLWIRVLSGVLGVPLAFAFGYVSIWYGFIGAAFQRPKR